MTRLAVLAVAAGLAGCGNYSNAGLGAPGPTGPTGSTGPTGPAGADVTSILPTLSDLQVRVPALPATAEACATRGAAAWSRAAPTAEGLDAAVGFLLGFVDVVPPGSPGSGDSNGWSWGPFDAVGHPGRELMISLVRTWPNGASAPPRFDYTVLAHVKVVDASWTPVLSAQLVGAAAATGQGSLDLDLDALWTLGLADADTPHGALIVQYDRTAQPVRVGVELDQDGFGLAGFGYAWAGYADGSGQLLYLLRNEAGDREVVSARFDAQGRGRNAVTSAAAAGGTASYAECWDEAACLTWVDDPDGVSCANAPCSLGSEGSCPAVP